MVLKRLISYFFALALAVQVLAPASSSYAFSHHTQSTHVAITDAFGQTIIVPLCLNEDPSSPQPSDHDSDHDHCPLCSLSAHVLIPTQEHDFILSLAKSTDLFISVLTFEAVGQNENLFTLLTHAPPKSLA
jgi:hypothetical protein